jgi:hypothetical protein
LKIDFPGKLSGAHVLPAIYEHLSVYRQAHTVICLSVECIFSCSLYSNLSAPAGVYNIVIKVSDSNGAAAFLQVVGVANGPLSQTNADGSPISSKDDGKVAFIASGNTTIVWWPATITVPFIVSTFWLGKRYMLRVMKKRIERGEHPFSDI